MSDSVQPHRRQPTRLPRPWDSPGKNTGMGCHFLLQCMKVKSESEVAQLWPTLSDPMDCGPPGSSVHGIFQARVLERGAIAFSDCHFLKVGSKRKLLEAKAGYYAWPLHTTSPKGWANPTLPNPWTHPLQLTPYKQPAQPSSGSKQGSKGTCYLSLLPPAAEGAPIKPCLNFFPGL